MNTSTLIIKVVALVALAATVAIQLINYLDLL